MCDDEPEAPAVAEPFLSRWSQRKREANQSHSSLPAHEGTKAEYSATAPEQVENLPESELSLPPLDTLDEHSDYSPFFSPEVSDELRRLALRKLFSGSIFNVRDGLDDYDEDYRHFESLGETITAEMRYRMERLEQRDKEDGPNDTLKEQPAVEASAAVRQPPALLEPDPETASHAEADEGVATDDTTDT